jgi:hypothetical protein
VLRVLLMIRRTIAAATMAGAPLAARLAWLAAFTAAVAATVHNVAA